jgi:transcriptional regulator with XRE-family HTH domain
MPRPENSISSSDPLLAAFASELRALRGQCGLSYSDLAVKAHYSSTALSRAANGRKLPTQALTLAYVRGCGGNEDHWRTKWEQIHHVSRTNRSKGGA